MQDFYQDKRLYFVLVLPYFDHVLHDVYITWVIMYNMRTSSHLCRVLLSGYGISLRSRKQSRFGHLSLIKDPPSGYWFSPLKKILYGVSGYLSLMQDIIFGLLVFTPKANSIWGLRLSKSYAGHHLWVTGFHPKANSIWGFRYPSLMQDSPSGH